MGARQSKSPGPVIDISNVSVDVSNVSVDISNVSVDISNETVDISSQAVDVSNETVDISSQAVDVSNETEAPRDSSTPQEIIEPSRTTSIFSCCSSLPAVAKPEPVPVIPENKDSDVKTEPVTANPEPVTAVQEVKDPENKDSGVGSQDPASA